MLSDMNDLEIIQQYHTQEKNKQKIWDYYKAINSNDWDTIEQAIDRFLQFLVDIGF